MERVTVDNPDIASGLDALAAEADSTSNPQVRQTVSYLLGTPQKTAKTVGKDRINCITMWFPQDFQGGPLHEGAYDIGVAILANNDKSVSVVSLVSKETLDEVRYPDCVNRAAISPDGGLLVAVCDDPYLYVHERCEKSVETPDGFWPDGTAYRWRLRNKIHLSGQSKDDRTDSRGSFAICFSGSGRYLAVATQYGVISLFDATTLTNSSVISLLTSFQSSRPGVPSGAVRDMEFAPGPLDLLAWTEDRNRFGVADMRDGCISRQIIHLDEDVEKGYEQVSVIDRGSIDPRLLHSSSSGDQHDNESSPRAVTPGISPESRIHIERLNQPLSRDETIVLEALQDQSRRRLQRAGELRRILGPETSTANSTSDNTADAQAERRAEMRRHLLTRHPVERQRPARNDELDDIPDPVLRQTIMHRQAEVEAEQQRRLSTTSLTVAPPPPMRSTDTFGSRAATVDEEIAAQLATRRSITARIMAHYPSSNGGASSNAWAELETLYNLSRDYRPSYEGLRTAVDADARRRDRAAFLLREWEANPLRNGGMGLRMHHQETTPHPYNTEGLAWAEDGRTLYVIPRHGTMHSPSGANSCPGILVPRTVSTSSR